MFVNAPVHMYKKLNRFKQEVDKSACATTHNLDLTDIPEFTD